MPKNSHLLLKYFGPKFSYSLFVFPCVCAAMPCICCTVLCQTVDPGELTQRPEEWQENEKTITVPERREYEDGAMQENTDTQPTEYQRQ